MTLYSLTEFINGDINKLIEELKIAENAERLKSWLNEFKKIISYLYKKSFLCVGLDPVLESIPKHLLKEMISLFV